MFIKEIIPDWNGLPSKKDSYSPDDKAIIVAKAAEVGSHVVAEAYWVN